MAKRGKGRRKAIAVDRSREYEKRLDEISRQRAALRRIDISTLDVQELGLHLSTWPTCSADFSRKLEALRHNGIHGADDVANALNRQVFKTAAGLRWTPRLVKIAKDLIAGRLAAPKAKRAPVPRAQATRHIYSGPSTIGATQAEAATLGRIDWNRADEDGL